MRCSPRCPINEGMSRHGGRSARRDRRSSSSCSSRTLLLLLILAIFQFGVAFSHYIAGHRRRPRRRPQGGDLRRRHHGQHDRPRRGRPPGRGPASARRRPARAACRSIRSAADRARLRSPATRSRPRCSAPVQHPHPRGAGLERQPHELDHHAHREAGAVIGRLTAGAPASAASRWSSSRSSRTGLLLLLYRDLPGRHRLVRQDRARAGDPRGGPQGRGQPLAAAGRHADGGDQRGASCSASHAQRRPAGPSTSTSPARSRTRPRRRPVRRQGDCDVTVSQHYPWTSAILGIGFITARSTCNDVDADRSRRPRSRRDGRPIQVQAARPLPMREASVTTHGRRMAAREGDG